MTDWTLHRRAQECIAQSYLTNSKRPESLVKGVYPTHVKRGQGCYLWDHQGQKYMDFICGLGTNILGYGNGTVNQAIAEQLANGYSHSLATHLELEAAEKVKELFPFVDAVKFLKSGSEACSAAIKIARAYQGVSYGSKNLHEMWLKEIARRLPPSIEEYWETERALQGLHQGLPGAAPDNGDQAAGPKEVRKDGSRKGSGETPLSEAPTEAQSPWERYRLLCSQDGQEGWKARQEFVRSMWRSEHASASRGLQSPPRREMALPLPPRTGTRWLILSDGYHGHHDSFTSLTAPGVGVPTDSGILPLTGNEDLLSVAAAVIIEPVITDYSPERIKWLQKLRDECTKAGTLLIFDEVITGCRFPKYSVANWTGIYPDLIVLGKAIANGMPLAAVGGKYATMNCDEYFVSSSYAGETLSLAAAKKTMELLQTKFSLDWLWEKGTAFLKEFNSYWPEKLQIEGYPSRGVLKGEPLVKALFMQEAAKAGMLFGPSWFFNFPLADEAPMALGVIKAIVTRIKNGEVELEGEMPKSPFAQRVREAQ